MKGPLPEQADPKGKGLVPATDDHPCHDLVGVFLVECEGVAEVKEEA